MEALNIKKRAAILIAFMWVIPQAFSQENGDEILNDYFQAIGGVEKIQNIHSYKLNLLAFSQGDFRRKIVFHQKRDIAYSRLEMYENDLGELTSLWILNDHDAYQIRKNRPKTDLTPIREDFMFNMRKHAFIDISRLIYEAYNSDSIHYVGIENYNDKPCYKFYYQSTHSLGYNPDVYFDKESKLLVAFVSKNDNGVVSITWKNEISDYRSVDGVMVPHAIYTYRGPFLYEHYLLQEIEINPEFDEKIFYQTSLH